MTLFKFLTLRVRSRAIDIGLRLTSSSIPLSILNNSKRFYLSNITRKQVTKYENIDGSGREKPEIGDVMPK